MDIARLLTDQWNAFKDAPIAYLASVILMGMFIYAFVSYLKGLQIEALKAEIDTQKARVQLKDDEIARFQRNLNVTTPDEAKKRLDDLEQRLSGYTPPRRLTADQKEKMLAALRHTAETIEIKADAGTPDGESYSDEFVEVLTLAGWRVQRGIVLGLGFPPPSGLGISVADPANLSGAGSALVSALNVAGIRFDLTPRTPRLGQRPDIEMIIARQRSA